MTSAVRIQDFKGIFRLYSKFPASFAISSIASGPRRGPRLPAADAMVKSKIVEIRESFVFEKERKRERAVWNLSWPVG